MSPITTHILDTSVGRPAAGVPVQLEVQGEDACWSVVASKVTDDDGRVKDLMEEGALQRATYRITFDTGAYFKARGVEGFYPSAAIVFQITEPAQHYHVPLLLNPFGYSTYRGS